MGLNEAIAANCVDAARLDKKYIHKMLAGKHFQRILDTGCGDAAFTGEIAGLVNASEVHGVEIEEGLFLCARERIRAIQADLNNALPYETGSFDLIMSIQNIEHLYFTDDYLEEMKRILKPGGTFIITTTNLAGLHYRLLLLLGIQPICLHPSVFQTFPLSGKNPRWGHKSVFTFFSLRSVLKKHGFRIVNSYSHTIYFVPYFISNAVCKLFPNWGTFSCFVVTK